MFRTIIIAALGAFWFSAPAAAIDLNPLSAVKGMVEAAVEDRSSGDIATDLAIKGIKNVVSVKSRVMVRPK